MCWQPTLPRNLIKARGASTLEDAFIAYLEEVTGSRGPAAGAIALPGAAAPAAPPLRPRQLAFSFQRLFAYTIRETIELLRDPIRLTFALFGTAFLMLVFGFGISTDVNNLTFAVLDHDQSHESRAYLEELRGSTYFVEQPALKDYADLQKRMQSGAIKAAIEIPPGFGRDLERGRPTWVAAWVDGAMPFRADTIRGYLLAMHQLYLTDPAVKTTLPQARPSATIEVRFKYNQNFESIYAMVPTSLSMLLALFPAILMALAVVREKELGSITNLYVTPVTRIEFLLGKQIPYIGVAMTNFTLMFFMALFLFQVPLKGSFIALLVGVLVYVSATTAYGMVISSFASTQIAALFGASILTFLPASQFSGMMVPVSSLSPAAQIMGRAFPMTYFIPISIGAFTKGLSFGDLAANVAELAVFHPGADADQFSAAAQARTVGVGSMRAIENIFWLGTKEIRSFMRDFVLLGLVIYAFSLAIMAQAHSYSQEVHNASVGLVDEDQSRLSRRIAGAFLPPYFQRPQLVAERDIVPLMNLGKYTFVIDIPPHFERDVLGGRNPAIQLNVDATMMVQAGLGADYAQQIIMTEIQDFLSHADGRAAVAGQSQRSHRVQSQPDDGLVHQRHGHHQQHQHAGDHPCRRGDRPRAGARHHGPSPGDAIDAVRDRHVQGLGERTGDHCGGRPFALSRRPHVARRSRSLARFRCSCSARRSISSLPVPSAYFSAP